MARNRMLNPDFFLDEDLAKLSAHARLLYQGLWGICDDNYATLPNRPEWIKAQVFPYEKIDIRRLLGELSESDHLILFRFENKEFWHIKNFFKYQKVEKPSKPKYPKFEAILRVVGEGSVSPLSEDKLSKEKIREEKVINTGASLPENNNSKEEISGNGPLAEDIRKRFYFTVPKKSKISTEWQERGFRYAHDLGIELKENDVARWLKIFKQAYGGRNSGNLVNAYTYCKDHPKWSEMDNEARMNMIFYLYENGLKEDFNFERG